MSGNKKLANIDLGNEKSVMEFLKEPTIKIAEVLTGILASDIKDWKLSAGRLIQSVIKGTSLTQLGREIEKYRKNGTIKDDYLEDDLNRMSLKELLSFIDDEAPDEIRFRAMKSIFLFSISKEASVNDEELAYEFMQICKQLSSGDILVLKAAYEIATGKPKFSMPNIDQTVFASRESWFKLIAQQLGHNLSALVERYEQKLMELKLITNIKLSYGGNDNSAFERSENFRLTPLGKMLCDFILKYD